MKLRDRKKRVLDHIKQEDDKPDLTLINASSSTVNVSSSWNREIKQEDTKNDSNLLQQDHGFGEGKDYYYQCDRCMKRMPNLKLVLQHRRLIHKVKRKGPSKIKDIDTEPDIHDPNFHCKSCNINYNSRRKYRHHLKYVHFMALKTILPHQIPQSSIVPDPDDPNLYCRACDSKYSCKSNYKQHCRYAHGMTSVKIATTGANSDGNVDPGKLPDPNDPQNYCKVYHHSISNRNAMIDINHPEFYCAQCERSYSSKESFRMHLRNVHNT
ncbi:hypothetical protein HMPREF1544_09651 [Mucor circinelloides 1006PhL]|uniref:C2H2-type domain-containing protein n=1 Tax=Mucor circinelloides f. circinelloides (strain 1006PhL) TaxID=1220926 RepID=S2JM23_MUCC1|nr:hypothetical protein HMPREF1544_09651 [Mucor circinelloides 1006PhL]